VPPKLGFTSSTSLAAAHFARRPIPPQHHFRRPHSHLSFKAHSCPPLPAISCLPLQLTFTVLAKDRDFHTQTLSIIKGLPAYHHKDHYSTGYPKDFPQDCFRLDLLRSCCCRLATLHTVPGFHPFHLIFSSISSAQPCPDRHIKLSRLV